MAILETYGAEQWEQEPDRVRVAALKLANGAAVALSTLRIRVVPAEYRFDKDAGIADSVT